MSRFRSLHAVAACLALSATWAHAQGADDLYDQMKAGKCQPALASLRADAEAGQADAQANLALAHYFGTCVPKDLQVAAQWTQKSADQGLAWAQRNMGFLYRDGEGGLPKNDKLALAWFRKAADQGDDRAQDELGDIFFYGRGVPKDPRAAADWYHKAATAGNADAQQSLGNMAEFGNGIAKDEAAAVEWYRKAAQQGHARAQFALGSLIQDGRGVSKNDREAA